MIATFSAITLLPAVVIGSLEATPRKRGRPFGSKGPTESKTPIASATPARCPRCKSTERTPYGNAIEREWSGVAPDGSPCTHVIWRACKCLACGQARKDKSYENRIAKN